MNAFLIQTKDIRQLQADHRALRAAITRLERQLPPSANNAPDWGRELWWGKTSKRSGETYPSTPANVYTVVLTSRSFDPTSHGDQTASSSSSDPAQYVTARTITGLNLPENTPVVLERHASAAGVMWWIRPPQSTIRRATASTSIAAGSSGNVAIKVSGLSDETVTAYYTWGDSGKPTIASGDEIFVEWDEEQKKWIIIPGGGSGSTAPRGRAVIVASNPWSVTDYEWRYGDASLSTSHAIIGFDGSTTGDVRLFPSASGDLSNADGLVFTVNDAPAAYTDTWLTLEQDGKYRVIWTGTWALYGLSLTDAQTLLRAAGHLHTAPGGVTSTESPDATGLEHRTAMVQSILEYDSGYVDTYSTHDIYAQYGGTTDVVYVKFTIIALFERSGTDVHVTPRLAQVDGLSQVRRQHTDCFITVEQISDS